MRLRQPQQVARRQRAADEAALARLVERHLERAGEFLVELDVDTRHLPDLQRHAELDPAPRDTGRDQGAKVAFDRGQRSAGMRSCKSRWRWFTARIVTAMVARSSSRVDARQIRSSI